MGLCLVGGKILTPLREITDGVVVIEKGSIFSIQQKPPKTCKARQEINVRGLFVAPGFIDIHVHGGGGHDVMEGSVEALEAIAMAHARGGTTAWLATTLTASIDQISEALHAIQRATKLPLGGARLLGAHLEGPYLSPEQAGAQNPRYLKLPDPEEYAVLFDKFPCIKRVSAAPEIPGGLELGQELRRRGILASIAHSNATYQQVLKAIECGYTHVTHIYSGTSMVRRVKAYRFAGIVEAALLLDTLTVEMIADGHHLPPSLMKLIIKAKRPDRVCVVTDAISATGLGSGRFKLGALDTIVEDQAPEDYEVKIQPGNYVAKLVDRSAFAGSVATMNAMVKNLVKLVELPLLEAVKMATLVPARVLGIVHERGTIAPNMKADLVVFDETFDVHMTIVEGNVVYAKEQYK